MDKLKHFIILFVLINAQFTSAQQTITLDETVFVHLNATTLVTGETLLYKVYCLKSSDKTTSFISKIAYVELVDDTKKTVYKNKIPLENATGQGDYFIPTTLKTGKYKLIAYTNWMLNKPVSELLQIDLTIINPYKAIEKTSNEKVGDTNNSNTFNTHNENTSNQDSIRNKNIKLTLNKNTFTNRELVDLKFESTNASFSDGSYSLSVRKLDGLPNKKQISAIDFSKDHSSVLLDLQNQENKIIMPELRGEMISGRISSNNNNDKVENIVIALSLPGTSYTFKTVKTDANGNFIFNINNTYYTPEITVQILNNQAANYNITLDNNPEVDHSKLNFETNSNLSYTTKESLLNRSISSQIENAYYHKKVDNLLKTPTIDPFYYPAAKEYILDNFARFKTLKETTTEVVIDVFIKQKDDKIYLHVNDPSIFPQLPEPALVLVDGLYLENQNELMTYNMKNVYKVEVIIGRYYVGPKSFNGLISFTTFDKDFKSTQKAGYILKTSLLRPLHKKKYNKIDYTNLTDNERIPDYRNQLFWNPEVKLNSDTNSFYTSDVSGIFEINLQGFAKNGSPVFIKEIIEVKDSSSN